MASRKLIEQAKTMENNNFSKVLTELAKAFKARGFFLQPKWNHVLNNNFNEDVDIDEEQNVDGAIEMAINGSEVYCKRVNSLEIPPIDTKVSMETIIQPTSTVQVSEELQQLKEIITPALPVRNSSVHYLPLSLLESHTSTPICSMKNTGLENLNAVHQSGNVSGKARNALMNYSIANLNGCNRRKIGLEANIKQSKIQYLSTFKNEKSQIDGQENSVRTVTKPTQRNIIVQNSSAISKTNVEPKLNENLPQIPAITGLTDVPAIAKSTSNVPENAPDNSDVSPARANKLNRFASFDDDSDDDNLLIPLKIRTLSPIKSYSRNEDIKIRVKIENEENAAVDLMKNDEITRRIQSSEWSQLCLEINKEPAEHSAFIQRKDLPIIACVHSVVADDNMEHVSELQDSKKKTNDRKRKLTEVLSDSQKTSSSVRTNQKTRKKTNNMSSSITRMKVMFAFVRPEPYALLLEKLHISLATLNTDFDVLVADRVCRSTKLMCALGSGRPIVSIEWLNAMQESDSRLDPFEYLLNDKVGEGKYNFSLPKTIKAAGKEKLFERCSILVTANTNPHPDVLKEVIVSSGGKYMKTTLVPRKGDRVICVSDKKDTNIWPKLMTKYPTLSDIIHVDGFARAIFKHSLDIKQYSLQN